MADTISRTPERLQAVCRVLMEFRPTEAARRLGICRQSIYRNMAEVRGHLALAGLAPLENSATNPPQLQM